MLVTFSSTRTSYWKAGEGDSFVTSLEVRERPSGPITRSARLPLRFIGEFSFANDEALERYRCVLHLQAFPAPTRGDYYLGVVAAELAARTSGDDPLPAEVVRRFPLRDALIEAVQVSSRNSDDTPVTRAQAIALTRPASRTSSTAEERRRQAAEAYLGAEWGDRTAAVAERLGLGLDEAGLRAAKQMVYRAKQSPEWATVENEMRKQS